MYDGRLFKIHSFFYFLDKPYFTNVLTLNTQELADFGARYRRFKVCLKPRNRTEEVLHEKIWGSI